ncbi:hypothetical protein B0H11DRAFT_2373765 [Mycena galericulata]|nr:hypothetical protein B0H11DRAFT_2373765 [Mycena galericulata]
MQVGTGKHYLLVNPDKPTGLHVEYELPSSFFMMTTSIPQYQKHVTIDVLGLYMIYSEHKPLWFFGWDGVGGMACKPIGRAWAGDHTQIHAPAPNKPFRAGASHSAKPKMSLSIGHILDLHEAVLVKTVHDLVSTSSILDTILQTYDDDQLFRIALHSDDHWNIVSTYFAKATVQPTHPASTINYAGPPAIASFPLQHLPVEVRARLLLFMDLRMLYDYSATCKAIHLNVKRHIGRFMKKAFVRIGPRQPNLRFMLAHTDSLLSGYQIHRLLFPRFTARGKTDVDVLDMFVHDFAAGAVSRFFEITTGFKIKRLTRLAGQGQKETFLADLFYVHSCSRASTPLPYDMGLGLFEAGAEPLGWDR